MGLKESGESAWMVDGASVSSQEANNSFSSEERVGEVCVSFDIMRSERIWKRSLEWQPRRAQSQAPKRDRCYFTAMSKRLGCFWNFSISRGWFVLLRLISPHKRKVRQNSPPPSKGSVGWILACLAGQTSGVSVKKYSLSLLLSLGADQYRSTLVLHQTMCLKSDHTFVGGLSQLHRWAQTEFTALFMNLSAQFANISGPGTPECFSGPCRCSYLQLCF